MHPIDINAALFKAGTNQSRLARTITGSGGKPISSVAVSHVIYGRTKSRRIARAISKATGLPLNVLWPGKYLEAK